MKPIKRGTIIVAIVCAVVYIIFSSAIQTTEYIGIMTRIFGMIALTALFLTVLLGELRMLGLNKYFKFHTLLGMATFYIVLLHFISAIFDKFKWGKSLSFVQYLGTTFSDKWMIALSVGAFAFYLIILIGATSSYSGMRVIGYQKWKLVHFLSYLTLVFAFGHSIVLGTDFHYSSLKVLFFPATTFVFSVLLFLLALRIAKVKLHTKKKLVGLLLLVFMVSGATAYFSTRLNNYAEELDALEKQNTEMNYDLDDIQGFNEALTKLSTDIQTNIANIKKESATLSEKIQKASVAPVADSLPSEPVTSKSEVLPTPIIENKNNNLNAPTYGDDNNEPEND